MSADTRLYAAAANTNPIKPTNANTKPYFPTFAQRTYAIRNWKEEMTQTTD